MSQLSAQGPIIAPAATSIVSDSLQLPVGTRMRDVSGNEFVYVQTGQTFGIGQWVSLLPDFTACGGVSVSTRGPIGVIAQAATSDQYVWVQIYGIYTDAQIGTSSFTSAYHLAAPTGATTESALIASSTDNVANAVINAWLTSADNTTDATSTIMTGYRATVVLNYPSLVGTTIKATT